MLSHRVVSLALLMVPFLSGWAFAQLDGSQYGMHIEQWWPTISGATRASTPSLTGTKFDVTNDFGLSTQAEGITDMAVWAKIFLPLYFDTYFGGFDNTINLPRAINFEGATIPQGSQANTHITVRAFTLMTDMSLGAAPRMGSSVTFGWQTGVHFMVHEIEETANGQRNVDTLNVIAPIFGFRASWFFADRFNLYTLIHYIQTSGLISSYDVGYIDFTVELRIYLAQSFVIGGGYRLINFSVDVSGNYPDKFEWMLSGGFVSIAISF